MLKVTVLLCLVGLALAAPSTNKVQPRLASSLSQKPSSNIFVKFHGGNTAPIRRISKLRFGSRTDQINTFVSDLKSLAESSQKNAIGLLKSRSPFSNFKQFWVSNELYISEANAQLVQQLAALPEVVEIREERVIPVEPFTGNEIVPNAEWNIERVKAQEAWALPGGNNGQGVVVANIDTGVRHTHEALANNYRSDHGWFDPTSSYQTPSDENGHGTHTMGIAVGAGGIGVAPGAQWIACKGCGVISCTESALVSCGQFVLCPTQPDGSAPDCSKSANVVSNSWGGGQDNDFYNVVIDAWKAVNIIPVFAAGNSGPSCGSIGSPGDQDAIAVGSILNTDMISASSSSGPSSDGRIKPDIVAPGQNIRSAWGTDDTAYLTISGTSMAAPHVAGAAALLISQNPDITYSQVYGNLTQHADKNVPDSGRPCDGPIPNNVYGYGILNARAALEAALGQS